MIELDYDEDVNKILIWTDEKNSTKECGKGEVAKRINHILEKRHFISLSDQKVRG
jgi:hypothetical protein